MPSELCDPIWHVSSCSGEACLQTVILSSLTYLHHKQEAFEKCWAHLPQRAAARRITIHQVSLVSRRTPPARQCPQQQQRQRVTEGTAMAP